MADPSSIGDEFLIDSDLWVLQADMTNKVRPIWCDGLAKSALERIGPQVKGLRFRQSLFVGMRIAKMLHRLSDVDQSSKQGK